MSGAPTNGSLGIRTKNPSSARSARVPTGTGPGGTWTPPRRLGGGSGSPGSNRGSLMSYARTATIRHSRRANSCGVGALRLVGAMGSLSDRWPNLGLAAARRRWHHRFADSPIGFSPGHSRPDTRSGYPKPATSPLRHVAGFSLCRRWRNRGHRSTFASRLGGYRSGSNSAVVPIALLFDGLSSRLRPFQAPRFRGLSSQSHGSSARPRRLHGVASPQPLNQPRDAPVPSVSIETRLSISICGGQRARTARAHQRRNHRTASLAS